MPAITSLDLSNAKLDVDHIAAIATSLETRATDRLGHSKLTMTGAIASISAITNRGTWTASTEYAVKDIVLNSGTWYIAVVAHTSSAAFATDVASKWRVFQGLTAGDLSVAGGDTLIGTTGTRKQSDKNAESRSITDYGAKPGDASFASVNSAAFDTVLALGDVFIPEGIFYINRAILIPSNRTIYGNGWSSVVKATSDFAPINCSWAGPAGMWFVFANSNIATSGYNENIEVLNVRSDWSIGPNNCHHFHMRNTQFTSARGNYFISGGDGTAFTLSKYYSVLNNFAWGTRNCCYDQWEGSSNGLVSNNIGFCQFGYGMLATGDTSLNTTGQTESITFTNNLIFGTSTADSGVGLWLQSGVNAGSVSTRCHASGNRLVGFNIGIRATGGGYHNITNNHIQFCPEAGIVLSAESGVLGSNANIISGNTITASGGVASAPILLQLGSSTNLIMGNRVISPTGSTHAIKLAADTSENVVNNNILDTGTTGRGSDLSASNHCDFDITFTPTLTSSGGGVPTYGTVYGKAKKIGGRVHFNMRINLTGLGTLASGALQIAGLPVVSANDDANDVSMVNAQFGSIVSTTTQPTAQIPANSSAIVLLKWNSTGNTTLTNADITGTTVFTISGSYLY